MEVQTMKCPICGKEIIEESFFIGEHCVCRPKKFAEEIERLETIRRDAIMLCDPWSYLPVKKLGELKTILGDFE